MDSSEGIATHCESSVFCLFSNIPALYPTGSDNYGPRKKFSGIWVGRICLTPSAILSPIMHPLLILLIVAALVGLVIFLKRKIKDTHKSRQPKSVVLRIFKRDDRAGRWLPKTGSFRASIHFFLCGKASFAPPIPGKPPGQPKNPSLTRPSSRGDTDSRSHLFRILANPLEFQLIVRLPCLDRRLAPEHSAPALGYLVPAPFFNPGRPGSQDDVQMIRPRFALLTSLRRDLEHNRVRKHLNSKEFRQVLQTALHPFPTVLVIPPRVGIQTAQKRPPNTAADAVIHPCLIPRYYCFTCLRHSESKHLFTFSQPSRKFRDFSECPLFSFIFFIFLGGIGIMSLCESGGRQG